MKLYFDQGLLIDDNSLVKSDIYHCLLTNRIVKAQRNHRLHLAQNTGVHVHHHNI